LRAGSLPGHANFKRLVFTNETFRPSLANRIASALISASVKEKYSFLLPAGLRISTNCNPY